MIQEFRLSPRSILDDHADLKAAGSHLLHSLEIKILRDELARAIAHGKKTERELGSTIENVVIGIAGQGGECGFEGGECRPEEGEQSMKTRTRRRHKTTSGR